MWNWVLVFVAMMGADFAWTKYTLGVAAKDAFGAASWSAVIVGCGAFTVVSYTTNRWLLIPALLGAFIGTYLAVLKEKNKT